MGFFKDFKEDLNQAVDELLPEDEMLFEEDDDLFTNDGLLMNAMDQEISDEESTEWYDDLEEAKVGEDNEVIDFLAKVNTLNESMESENLADAELTPSKEEAQEQETVKEELFTVASSDNLMESDLESKVEDYKMIIEMDKTDDGLVGGLMDTVEKNEVAQEVTVIGKETKINGSISSEGSVEILGTVEGDIDCLGKLSISGVVKGNSTAHEIFINAKRLEGNVTSEGNIKIGQGTVVIGDVNATAGVIAGAVKGQIDVNGAVVLDSTAIVKGNIKAKSVQINNGAVVDGYCSLTYAAVDIDNVFDVE